jgi:CO/xanthine dehydrogenase Mo-binding subunit
MTKLLPGPVSTRELSRKSFLKGGGALVVGFSIAGAGLGARAANAGDDPYASNGAALDLTQLDSWLMVHADNTATLKSGIVELGQGSLTGLLMIAAEELDLGMAQMRFVRHDTNVTPNQGSTSGSNGTKVMGRQVRGAAAAARNALLDLASASLGVPKSALSVDRGVVSGGGRTVTYGALVGDGLLNAKMPTVPNPAAGAAGTKPIAQYKVVGTRMPRVDIPDKISGRYTYVHNIRVPGMLHGRIVRPRGQGAFGDGTAPKLLAVDESSIRHIPDAKVVRFGNFLGVVASQEYAAIQAAAQLKATWGENPPLPGTGNLWKQMRDDDSAGLAPAQVLSAADTVHSLPITSGDVDKALASAATKLSQTYKFHWNGGMLLGPSCALADVTASGARVFSGTQDAYGLRAQVKACLDPIMGTKSPPLERIRVSYYEGSSPYGARSTTVDAAQGAAIMSALVGKPVRLQLMRWDEHGWNVFWTAIMFDIRAGVDARGNLVAVEHTDFLVPYANTQAAEQMVTGNAAFTRNPYVAATTASGLQYGIANRKTVAKVLPLMNNYFRTSYVRSPYRVQATWAAEQMFDELAHAAGMDPYEFRLQNVATAATDPQLRWRNVLTSVAKLANWQPKPAASTLSNAEVVSGRGIAFGFDHGTVIAGVAVIEVNKRTGKITPKHVYCCVDPGVAINPAGLQNNLEGDIVQVTSRTLVEQVRFDRQRVTSLDWVTYPILRFKDTPHVTVQVLSRADIPDPAGSGSHSGGGGEGSGSITAPAIANAFFDATGVRIRETPMTPARVRAALKAAGVG